MKNIAKTITGMSLAIVLASCERDSDRFENSLFIDAADFKNEVRVPVDEKRTEMSREIVVSMAMPEQGDVEISFVKSPELLDTYREAYYDPEAELLPDIHCDLSGIKAMIRKGEVSSAPVAFDFVELGEDRLDYEKSYVLPVTLVADGMAVLPRAKTVYFVIKEASLVNVAADLSSNCAWPEWGGFASVKNMDECTLEALVFCHDFKSTIQTVMGIEEHFLIRIGDDGLASNQIQVAVAHKAEGETTVKSNKITSPSLQLKAGRWYHVAVTFDKGLVKVYLDGELKAENKQEDIVRDALDFSAEHSDETDGKPRCFWVGYSYNDERDLHGMLAEVRVWKKVLTEEEINSEGHFYKLYPDADTAKFPEDLVAYWKFNDEKGKTVKDWSVSGKNLTADHDLLWYPVELPAK